ncbi:unnamed protein product, partial [Angiostrongylus costaricensis]|uniref:Pleckstrin homology domain-containing family M member 2 n=1 Tax=Angiostrongylus costaricensis TaxID=334426 RepID=A0A0R3PUQ5_ANGCS
MSGGIKEQVEEASDAADAEVQAADATEVLRRADESRKGVRVVLEGRELLRYGTVPRGVTHSKSEFYVEKIPSEDDERRGDLLQMDSIPESVTTSTSPTYVSHVEQLGYLSDNEHKQSKIAPRSRIETLRTRLWNWFQTLDYDGEHLNDRRDVETRTPTSPLGQDVNSFIDVFSTGVVVLALLELYKSSLQSSYSLHYYCNSLSQTVFHLFCSDVERFVFKSERIAAIDEFCSQLVLHIFRDIYMHYSDNLGGNLAEDEDSFYEKELTDSSISSLLSTCYEILQVDVDSSEEDYEKASRYSSLQYPLEDWELIESQVFVSPQLGGIRSEECEAVHPSYSPMLAQHASINDEVSSQYSELPDEPVSNNAIPISYLESIRKSIEQISKYEPEIFDESYLPLPHKQLPPPMSSLSGMIEDKRKTGLQITEEKAICPPSQEYFVSDSVSDDTCFKAQLQFERNHTQRISEMKTHYTETDNENIIQKPYDELLQIRDTPPSNTKNGLPEHLPSVTMEEKPKYKISQEKTDTAEYRAAYKKLLTFSKVAHHDIYTDLQTRSDLEFPNNLAPMHGQSPSKLKRQHNTSHPLRDDWYTPSGTPHDEPYVDESIMYKREAPCRPPLPSQSIDQLEASPPDKVADGYVLTQQELDHIAWIQRLAEETLEAKPIDALPAAVIEDVREGLVIAEEDVPMSSSIQVIPSVNVVPEGDQSKEESEPTSGADQGTSTEQESPSEEVVLYERSSPLLEYQHEISPPLEEDRNLPSSTRAGEPFVVETIGYKREPPCRPPLPSQSIDQLEASPPHEVADGYVLTQEELDHIAWIQRLAEDTLEAKPIDALPAAAIEGVREGLMIEEEDLPMSSSIQVSRSVNAVPEGDQSKEESEPTSGADQGTSSEQESPSEEMALYERSSPLLEDQHEISPPLEGDRNLPSSTRAGEPYVVETIVHKREPPCRPPLPSQSIDQMEAFFLGKPDEVADGYVLTQEEVDHIAW